MNNLVVISGCSGGGKSTLLAELARRGHMVVQEPGLRIVQEETLSAGSALPWVDLAAFLNRAIAMAQKDYAQAKRRGAAWVFFDRGLIDAAAAIEELTGTSVLAAMTKRYRYHRRVFLAPPWPEIYVQNAERRHDMVASVAEFNRLERAYPMLGYEITLLPKIPVEERADFVLATLSEPRPAL